MPPGSPTSTTAIPRDDLSGAMPAFGQRREFFIARQLMGVIRASEKSGDYSTLGAGVFTQAPDARRNADGTFNRIGFAVDGDTFNCEQYGLEGVVDSSRQSLYASRFDLEMVTAEALLAAMDINLERRVVAGIVASYALSGTTGTSLTHEWDDTTNSTPLDDVLDAKRAVREKCGLEPDTLVITPYIKDALSLHPDVIDRIKYINPAVNVASLQANDLAQFFGVRRVLVPLSMYNTADKGQTASLATAWDDDWVFLAVTSQAASVEIPRVGSIVAWEGGGGDLTIEEYRDEPRDANVLRVKQALDEKFHSTAYGYRIGNTKS